MPSCSVPGCTRPYEAKGLCHTHYLVEWKKTRPHTPCTMSGCEKAVHARGLCALHFGRLRRYGDPAIARPRWRLGPRRIEPPIVRFWRKVDKTSSPHGCWIWTSTLCRGYGHFHTGHADGKIVGAHRYAWELANGPIPEGMDVCHTCDAHYPPGDISYRRCIRPDHLFLGTHQDNMDDKVLKGRQAAGATHGSRNHPERVARGERHGCARLTEAHVIAIRAAYVPRKTTQQSLADRFGVSRGTIGWIVRGETWRATT